MAIWFGGVLLIGGAMFVGTVATLLKGSTPPPANAWLGIAIAPLMLVCGVAMIGIGKFFARNERQFLVDFLRLTIDAREA